MNDWIKHNGRGMPVSGDTYVFVRFGDGKETDVPVKARDGGTCWNYSSMAPQTNIVAYRICVKETV